MPKPALDAAPLLVGSSETFRSFQAQLEQVAKADATVLLSGESGSGKGAAARAIHHRGGRAQGPLVEINLASLAPSLVESELFGHERGAFTGAHRDRDGCFRRASGGTLVLDDVGLLPLAAQVKLLRVLQERTVEPLGAEAPVPVDARVVATTGGDLEAAVRAGEFREDLYYRLAVVPLRVPPLRARLDDLGELAQVLMQRLAERHRAPARPLSDQALERLSAHAWPGNVRELENALERVLVLAPRDGAPLPVAAEELEFLDEATDGLAEELASRALAAGLTVEGISQAMMECALEEQRGNLSAAARQVGLTRRAFEYRLGRHAGEEAGGDPSDGDAGPESEDSGA